MGRAMRARWLWQQFLGQSLTARLPGNTNATTKAFFRASTRLVLGDGNTIRFWSTLWLQGQTVEEIAPQLYAAISRRARCARTVATGLPSHSWCRDITGALTISVLVQFLRLHQLLKGITLQPDSPDKLIWRWSPSGEYSTATALSIGQASIAGVKEVWKTKASGKCCFFIWLLLLGWCWTSERLRWHGL
jgi:hypothetical protein